tara:strand:- start:324 stop:689 length:366 start_codon:yes stop_codon:yes gene_type:complete
MKKSFKKDVQQTLPHEVQVFMKHLELGLQCFDLDFYDFKPCTMNHTQHGAGLLISQLSKERHEECCMAENSLIISKTGVHINKDKILFFSNEQPPTHLALLVLSAMVQETPLNFECEHCDV